MSFWTFPPFRSLRTSFARNWKSKSGQGHTTIMEDVTSFCEVCTELLVMSSDSTARIDVNMIGHASEMEYIILTIL